MRKENSMKTVQRVVLIAVISFTLTMVVGCGSRFRYSGFLKDYPDFKPGSKDGADLVYVKENVDFKYNKVMMDHVVFWFRDNALYQGIHVDELSELADAFHKAMTDALNDGYPLVTEPGPDVLRIRCAITDVVATRPLWSTATTATSKGLTIKRSMTEDFNPVGGASMEIEMLDSQSNERIAAAIDTKVAEGNEVVKGLKKWGHAENTFNFWAKRLRLWLDEVHGR
jgi:hypothetical protein